MKVFISGAEGLIGKELVKKLQESGHEVTKLVRRATTQPDEINWDTRGRNLDPSKLKGCDSLIHLAGEPISGWRWTENKMKQIYESRIDSTDIFSQAIMKMETPVKSFIVASGASYYGERGADLITESEPVGDLFLSEVAHDWEQAAQTANSVTRVVNIRTCMVLSGRGGALKSMLPAFKSFVGGPVGSGDQYWSWISLPDIVNLYAECVTNEALTGPINAGSPEPETCRDFSKTLGQVLNRPAVMKVPGIAIKAALGQMGQELLLTSTRIVPEKLQQAGFQFQYPTLKAALENALKS